MNDVAALIDDDDGQIVILPEKYWFDVSTVRISREGNGVTLTPVDDDDASTPATTT